MLSSLLLAAALLAADPSFDRLAADADAARQSNRLDDAAALYSKALLAKPSWLQGWWYLGTIEYERERWTAARDALVRFVALEPKAGPGLALLGLSEYQLGNYDVARMALGRAREVGLGPNPQIQRVSIYHLGLLENLTGQPDIALRTLKPLAREAVAGRDELLVAFGLAALRRPILPPAITPASLPLFRAAGLGQAHFSAGDWPSARTALEQLVAAYPAEPGVHYLFGTFLLVRDREQAIAEFEREIALVPGHVPARLQIAFDALRSGDSERGLRYAGEAVKLDPNLFAARNAYGRLLIASGNLERGIEQLEAGARLEPNSADMQFALAQAYAKVGRRDDAAKARAEFKRLDALRAPERKAALQQ